MDPIRARPHRGVTFLVLVGLVVLFAAGFAWLARTRRASGGASGAPTGGAPAGQPELVAAREALAPAPGPPEPGTARAFLAEYHGARWPEVEAAMERAGLPLDQPFEPQPWEEVEPALRSKARLDASMRHRLENKDWVAPLTNEWLQKEYEFPADLVLDGAELAELEAELAQEMLALQAADKAYADRLDFHLQSAFERGEYVAAPFSITGLSDELGFFAKALVSGTWAAGIVLRNEECPDLMEISAEIRSLEDERDRRVDGFLKRRAAR